MINQWQSVRFETKKRINFKFSEFNQELFGEIHCIFRVFFYLKQKNEQNKRKKHKIILVIFFVIEKKIIIKFSDWLYHLISIDWIFFRFNFHERAFNFRSVHFKTYYEIIKNICVEKTTDKSHCVKNFLLRQSNAIYISKLEEKK